MAVNTALAQELAVLRLELLRELASLPDSLRSDFPDLAVDYLASALRGPPQPPKQPRSAAASPTSSRHGQDASVARGRQSAHSSGPARAQGLMQQLTAAADVLQAVDLEVASIESTTLAKLPHGADIESDAAASAKAPLLTCTRCRKVLLPSAAARHAGRCTQQLPADAATLSISSGTTGGPPLSSATAGGGGSTKRRRSDSGLGSGGGQAASRLRFGSRLAPSSSPDIDEGEQEEFEYARAAAPKAERAASLPLALGPHQRRPRAQQPPRMRRHALCLVPWRDLEAPILLSPPPAAAAMQRARGAGRTANLQPQLFYGAGGSSSYCSLGHLPQSSSGGYLEQQQHQHQHQHQQRRQSRW